jgi:hypothetical protein
VRTFHAFSGEIGMLRQTNLISGLAFLVLALAFGFGATSYRFGTPANMGAGFLPVSLAILLGLLGVAIMVQSLLRSSDRVDWGRFRPAVLIIASILVFALGMRPLGFAAAAFLTVLLSSFAGPPMTWLQRLLPALILSATASLLFVQLLGLPIPLWPTVLG